MGEGNSHDDGSTSDPLLREVARAPDAALPEGLSLGGTLARFGPAEQLVGRRLLHFHVVERLGAGGMGVVYKAIDEKLRRPVALKVLAAKYLVDDRNKGLIFREARSAAAVHHPNIATIYDVHDVPEAAFLAMELVEGETLRERLGRGALPFEEALGIATQIADGLACAHAAGVVHRDLKPDNVMLEAGGRVKLLDFGLAKVVNAEEPLVGDGAETEALATAPTEPAAARSTHAHVMGTPAYMAPEQARGEAVDARVDVFAFGVVLYEMLTGEAPFPRRAGSPWTWGDDGSSDWKVRTDGVSLRRRVGAKVEALVVRCLDPDRSRRFDDACAISVALGDLKRAQGASAFRRRALSGAAALLLITTGALGLRVLSGRSTNARVVAGAPESRPSAHAHEWTERTLTSLESNIHVWAVALAHDRTRIAFIAGETLWVQQVASGERSSVGKIAGVQTGRQGWYSLDWFPGDRALLVGSSGNGLEIIDVPTRSRRVLRLPADLARLAPDGTRLAWVENRTTVRVEPAEGAPHASSSSVVSLALGHAIWDLAWSPSGKWLALLTETPNPADMEVVVVEANGAAQHVVAHGMFFTKDANVGVAWRSDERLLFVRAGARGGAAEIAEVEIDRSGEAASEATVLPRRSAAEPSALTAVGDSVAFVLDEVQDDVFVAGLSATGDALDRPFARATQSDSRDALIGWTSPTRFAFLSNRGQADRLAVFEQEIDGTPRAIAEGPDIYLATRPGVLTEGGDVLYWRGGEGADPPRPCELVRMALRNGSDGVVAVPDETLACRSRVACAAGRCVVVEKHAWAWLDLATGKRSARIIRDSAKQDFGWEVLTVARDGRIAAVQSDGTPSGSLVTILRADGTRERETRVEGVVQSLSFAPDGRHLYATNFYADGQATLIALDAQGGTHVLTPTDGRWRINPWVTPDGRSIAITVRTRRENVALLELGAADW
jgi:eukaryotic-like serine/threonine-protein kinase